MCGIFRFKFGSPSVEDLGHSLNGLVGGTDRLLPWLRAPGFPVVLVDAPTLGATSVQLTQACSRHGLGMGWAYVGHVGGCMSYDACVWHASGMRLACVWHASGMC